MIRNRSFQSFRRPLLAAFALTLTVSAAAWAEPHCRAVHSAGGGGVLAVRGETTDPRRSRPRGGLPFAMTGWGQEEDRRRSREAGFDQHLVKPLDPKGLEELLARAVRWRP